MVLRKDLKQPPLPASSLPSCASVFVILLTWALPQTLCSAGDVTVRFLQTPPPVSAKSSAVFSFEVLEGSNGSLCSNCVITCKLDNFSSSDCSRAGTESYTGLSDGNHTFTVCTANSSHEEGAPSCASYSWAVDTVPPTAFVRAESSFTNASNASVHVTFSEPCSGGGGFTCSQKDCNLIVYGPGRVLPSTLQVLQPGMKYSIIVEISTTVQYGRLFLVMDKRFCTDAAGNRFTRTSNSSFVLHFDRRGVSMNITTLVPKKIVQLNGVSRIVEATNDERNLKVYLAFSDPVLNTSEEILGQLHTTSGIIFPARSSLGNRRFSYILNSTSSMAIVTVTCDASSIISRQGTPASLSDPFTFLYDTQRPTVKLATAEMRTTEQNISVFVEFEKPVLDFNSSAILVSGGQLLSFHEASRSLYNIQIQAADKLVSVKVAENTAQDVAGNLNIASNVLQVRHYSVPTVSSILSIITTVLFLATAIVAALLSVSTSSLLSSGAFSKPAAFLLSEPSRNLVRIACHIQVFALSRWLSVNLPIEYYELAKGIQWIIPYLPLPWEAATADPFMGYASLPAVAYSELLDKSKVGNFIAPSQAHGELPIQNPLEGTSLTEMEYRSFFENQDMKPEAPFIMYLENSKGWKYFGRNMFWLAIIGGGLVLLHAAIVLVLSLKNKEKDKKRELGALVFPRFEVILIILALPCMCQAAAALIRGGATSGLVVGIVLMGILTSFLVALLLFLSLGITMGKLLQYKEVHQLGQEYHWYHEIVRRTLGPGKRGQWTWNEQENTACLTKLGPLFEDLRGPPKYMLTQIATGSTNQRKHRERIIASEDENEDAEAPFIQKLFGILRIYYTFQESVKRAALGIVAGAHATSVKSSRIHVIVMLSIAALQLGFMMVKKPFIKKRVQLVEIIAVASEVYIFAACLVLIQNDLSDDSESRLGLSMLAVFVFMFAAQMINEWCALYQQILLLSPDENSFSKGLKTASTGLLLVVLPARLFGDLNQQLSSNNADGDPDVAASSPNSQMQLNSGGNERSWLRQLQELAKASFTKDSAAAPTDPSSSTYQIGGSKRSRSSSVTSSSDFTAKGGKGKSKGLYKDLEAIFSPNSN